MISKSLQVGQFVIVGPITGATDTDAQAPITGLSTAVSGGVTVEDIGNNSYKVTGVMLGAAQVMFVAKNSINQNVSEVLSVTVTAPVATKLVVPVSDPQ